MVIRKALKVLGTWMEKAVKGSAKSHTVPPCHHTSAAGSCTACCRPTKAWWRPSPPTQQSSPDLHAARWVLHRGGPSRREVTP